MESTTSRVRARADGIGDWCMRACVRNGWVIGGITVAGRGVGGGYVGWAREEQEHCRLNNNKSDAGRFPIFRYSRCIQSTFLSMRSVVLPSFGGWGCHQGRSRIHSRSGMG